MNQCGLPRRLTAILTIPARPTAASAKVPGRTRCKCQGVSANAKFTRPCNSSRVKLTISLSSSLPCSIALRALSHSVGAPWAAASSAWRPPDSESSSTVYVIWLHGEDGPSMSETSGSSSRGSDGARGMRCHDSVTWWHRG